MKKSAIVLFFVTLFSVPSVFAQNVQDGVSHMYAERYESAKQVFDKLLASNPNNIEAVYWAGQNMLEQDDVAGAKALYEKTLAANGNAPLALVGMGHVDLLEGRLAEGRQRFESAISASKSRKGNDPTVLTAIGRANVDAYTEKNKNGDLDYAIAKLNEAAQREANNAEIYLVLGNAYRKKHEGGQAVVNYARARTLAPNFAMPSYRLASLYKTQQNWDVVNEHLNNALTADPKFAPAYLDLYYYYLLYPKDFAKAEEYANKYLENADKSVENDYIKAQTAYVQKKYDEAISVGKNILSVAGDRANPRVYRLLGYSLVEKGDSTAACQYVGQFFAKAQEEDIIGQDYILQADACGADNPSIVKESYYKAATMDSVLYNQVNVLNQGIERFQKSGQKIFEADLRALSYQLRGDKANPAELFQIGLPYYQGGQYQRADSVFKAYSAAFPDSVYGYYWSALSLAQIDSTMSEGLAVPSVEKTLEVAEKDKERLKSMGLWASGYLAGYYNNVKNDRETAITYLKKALEFDPTNAGIQKNLEILEKASKSSGSASKTKSSTGK